MGSNVGYIEEINGKQSRVHGETNRRRRAKKEINGKQSRVHGGTICPSNDVAQV